MNALLSKPVRVVCERTTRPRGLTAVAERACADCGAAVWVAPSTLAVLANPPPEGARVNCMECAAKAYVREKAAEPYKGLDVVVSEAQEREVLGVLGISMTEALRETLGVIARPLDEKKRKQ